jgi:hypothetical protein
MSKGRDKGNAFERCICKQLSLWWSDGKSDAIFWRSHASGGWANHRAQKGLKTHGNHGDITAIDPSGNPLVQFWTIELKRGAAHKDPAELIECPFTPVQKPFEAVIEQVVQSHVAAGSHGWMIISRKDHRQAVCYIDIESARLVCGRVPAPKVFYNLAVKYNMGLLKVKFFGCPLENFLRSVSPGQIVAQVELKTQKGSK